jgi:hypothetical protein
MRAAAGLLDQGGDVVEFGLGARRDDNVGTGLGESQRYRRAETAACAGDDGDLTVETESVEYHVRRLATDPRCVWRSGLVPRLIIPRTVIWNIAAFLAQPADEFRFDIQERLHAALRPRLQQRALDRADDE